jgi:hypothetical protein
MIQLAYTDLFGEQTRMSVMSRVTSIQEGMGFKEAITDSDATNTARRHVPRDAELERFESIDQRGIFFDPCEESD